MADFASSVQGVMMRVTPVELDGTITPAGHVLTTEGLSERAGKLDRFYIPTRYANGFENGAPKEFFFKSDAEEAIGHARAIIHYCKSLLPR